LSVRTKNILKQANIDDMKNNKNTLVIFILILILLLVLSISIASTQSISERYDDTVKMKLVAQFSTKNLILFNSSCWRLYLF